MDNILQIAFDGFKVIDLGKTFALEAYQRLYQDHSEPIGLISIVQAFGQLLPSDKAIDDFNNKWKNGSRRWKLVGTGIEVITGKSSTTGEMAKTDAGVVTLLVISFLIDALGAETTSDLARRVINKTPAELLPIRPQRAQVANVVSAVQSQTGNVSWEQEIKEAQSFVLEKPAVYINALSVPMALQDIPVEAMRAFYQALCAISRVPGEYHCILRTTSSITLPFVLAHSICGLQVCVVVDGDVVHGGSISGQWQVKLQREQCGSDGPFAEIKMGRKLETPELLLKIDDVGPRRANRIGITGIAKAATIGQGLDTEESKEIAKLAIWAAEFILEKLEREVGDEWGSNSYASSSESGESASLNGSTDGMSVSDDNPQSVPVKTRLTTNAICTWWGCSEKTALSMLRDTARISAEQSPGASWAQMAFSKRISGKISQFADLDRDRQMELRRQTCHALNRKDFAQLTRMLTTQLLLITLLKYNGLNNEQVRVRSSCSLEHSELGMAVKKLNNLKPLRLSDALFSWHFWLHGRPPQTPESNYGLGGPDVLAIDGYLVYRSLLFDLNLSPNACEMVTVEPGHICLDDRRLAEICGPDEIPVVNGEPYYREHLQARAKLKSRDSTGPVDLTWTAAADEDSNSSLDLGLLLRSRNSGLEITASVYHIAKLSWGLQYGDRSLGCEHDEDRVGEVFEGERIEVTSAGKLRKSNSEWKALQLLSANGSDLGQIACLLSAPPDSYGMVRGEACLRCCVTACNRKGLGFLID